MSYFSGSQLRTDSSGSSSVRELSEEGTPELSVVVPIESLGKTDDLIDVPNESTEAKVAIIDEPLEVSIDATNDLHIDAEAEAPADVTDVDVQPAEVEAAADVDVQGAEVEAAVVVDKPSVEMEAPADVHEPAAETEALSDAHAEAFLAHAEAFIAPVPASIPSSALSTTEETRELMVPAKSSKVDSAATSISVVAPVSPPGFLSRLFSCCTDRK